MSLAKRSALRAAVNRRVQFEGPHEMTTEHVLLRDVDVKVLRRPKNKTGEITLDEYKAGTVISVATKTKIDAYDKVLLISYPAILYDKGMVSGPTLVDGSSGMARLRCIVELVDDLDISNIGPFKVHIEGE